MQLPSKEIENDVLIGSKFIIVLIQLRTSLGTLNIKELTRYAVSVASALITCPRRLALLTLDVQ